MDIIGVHLKEALNEGCPVCRILRNYEENEIETVLYEHVNDPWIRERFKESLGLCTYHAWQTVKKAYSEPLLGPLGVSIIYEHMLSLYVSSIESGKSLQEEKCFLCSLVEEKERDTVEALVERIEELLPAYEESESILCRRHYEMTLAVLEERNPKAADRLKSIQLKKLKTLRERINAFIDKFDYRAEGEPTKEEISSLPLTVEALKGLEVIDPLQRLKAQKRRRRFQWR